MVKEEYIKSAYKKCKVKSNPWKNTVYEEYSLATPKTKGVIGENIVEQVLINDYDFKVYPRQNSSHDRIIGNFKVEIKFSCAAERNLDYKFTFNHISPHKDFDRIIFLGINGDIQERIVWFNKEDIYTLLEEGIFSYQAGEKKYGNDIDLMCASSKTKELLWHRLAKEIKDWNL